ncbi:hypothetical protein PENSPDRAFT_757547 [Peniophora sp. CONT]|nr:hypothetical protein PENSPDRAFT_757547 [Peniophora sp. CONT]
MSSAVAQAAQLSDDGLQSLARYQHSHALEDLDESVESLQHAVELIATDKNLKAMYLTRLGNALSIRFMAKGDTADINAAIDAGTAATEVIPDSSTEKPAFLANLGNAFRHRFSRLGSTSDADCAVDAYRRAVELVQDSDARRPLFFMNCGLTLRTRFDVTGNLEDLEEAVIFIRKALALLPRDNLHHAACLNNLGLCLMRRFERSFDPVDIDEAVDACRLSVHLTLDEDIHKGARWHTLANALDARSEWLNLSDIEDIDAAVFAAQQAVQAMPDGHPEKPNCLNTLCLALRRRSQVTRGRQDMEDMITAGQRAVELCPNDSLQKAMLYDTLGASLLASYRTRHDSDVLNAAIDAARQAVETSIATDSHVRLRLTNFAIALDERFSLSKHPADIELAIHVARLAVNAAPTEDSLRGMSPYLLARLLQHSHDVLGSPLETDTILNALEVVATSPGPVQWRFDGARLWAAVLTESRGIAASLPAWKLVVELVPKVIWMGRKLEDRHNLSQIEVVAEVLPDAIEATLALDDGSITGYSVEWLETRRCVIWGQYDNLRAPLDSIRASDARLAEELESVSKRLVDLDVGKASTSIDSILTLGEPRPDSGKARRTLALRFELLVEQARKLPGCAGFLLQKSLADLKPAATFTPIIMLVQLDNFCRVFVQLPPGNQYYYNKIPFTREMAVRVRNAVHGSFRAARARGESRALFTGRSNGAKRQDDCEKALRLLWIQLVRPILDAIKSRLAPGPSGELPRVTWSPTGILSFLPLHAAGIYSGDALEAVYDRVVSSYTPNLTALLHAERRRASSATSQTTPKILAISQPGTPGQPAIPGTYRNRE